MIGNPVIVHDQIPSDNDQFVLEWGLIRKLLEKPMIPYRGKIEVLVQTTENPNFKLIVVSNLLHFDFKIDASWWIAPIDIDKALTVFRQSHNAGKREQLLEWKNYFLRRRDHGTHDV